MILYFLDEIRIGHVTNSVTGSKIDLIYLIDHRHYKLLCMEREGRPPQFYTHVKDSNTELVKAVPSVLSRIMDTEFTVNEYAFPDIDITKEVVTDNYIMALDPNRDIIVDTCFVPHMSPMAFNVLQSVQCMREKGLPPPDYISDAQRAPPTAAILECVERVKAGKHIAPPITYSDEYYQKVLSYVNNL